jgi:predicted ester cyclase
MAFPDLRVMIEHQVAEGDRVVTRNTMQGTYQGEVQGMTPTGKRITSTGIVIDRYAGGKIVEVWNIGDAVSMLQQVSAPAKAKA